MMRHEEKAKRLRRITQAIRGTFSVIGNTGEGRGGGGNALRLMKGKRRRRKKIARSTLTSTMMTLAVMMLMVMMLPKMLMRIMRMTTRVLASVRVLVQKLIMVFGWIRTHAH